MASFGLYNLINYRNYFLVTLIFSSGAGLIAGWFLIRYTKNGKIVYRINSFIFSLLILYMLLMGGEGGSKILWMYTFPLISFFLFGKNEGIFWSITVLLIAIILFWNPSGWPIVFDYPKQFEIRFVITYFIVSVVTYWFEYFRYHYRINSDLKTMSLQQEIVEREKAEKEKINAQKIASEQKKLALVGQVAGKMAHDFNNILGIVMGNAELTLQGCKDVDTKKTLELILEQTLRGRNLTRNLVAFAKSQEPKQEFFKIDDKIDSVINLLKQDLVEIELIKEDGKNMPELLADSSMIEHALVNLFQNSIHALSKVENPKIIIRTYCLRKNIYFEIEDNGCGIPSEWLGRIYEPSFTLKGSKDTLKLYKVGIKGTGYGMANVKKYIEQHKGDIFVESEFRTGTKITVKLPFIKKELTSEEKIEIKKSKLQSGKHILLVEDEKDISDVQSSILTNEPCNHEVDIATSGQVAIDLFVKNKYDFISLDYMLEGNTNGMDVYTHIRQTDKAIPILFISGNIEFLESIQDLKQKDPNIDHLSKPCMNKDYITSINDLFERT